MKHRNKSFNDYRGFQGPDVDIETSLREYGLIWKKVKKTEYLIVYGIHIKEDEYRNSVYDRFTYTFMSEKDWKELLAESWFNLDKVVAFCGMSKEVFIDSFPFMLDSAIAYHGTENILGTNYSEGYSIGGEV